MRRSIREFVELCVNTLELPSPIYEFGSYQVEGQESLADLRPLFPGRMYVGSDVREGPGVDIVIDAERTGLPDASVGTVLCLDTFEHMRHPWLACEEFARILRPEGVAVLSSLMAGDIHAYPDDFWRFTPSAFRVLLHGFDFVRVSGSTPEGNPRAVVAVAAHRPPRNAEALDAALAAWKSRVRSPLYLLERVLENPGLAWGVARSHLHL